MRLTDAAEPTFARHETFHPRYGWFRKAYNFAAEDPRIFIREDAPVRLGVGKNMVRAIRFWGLAAKLIEPNRQSSKSRASELAPTPLGHSLFGDSGWDRYMEDPGTLWLLHWLLLARPCRLPVWWLAFNEFHPVEFADDDLEAATTAQLGAVAGWVAPHPSSVKKDVSALLRTYAPAARSARAGVDDLLDCPASRTESDWTFGGHEPVSLSRWARSPPCRPRSWPTPCWISSPAPMRGEAP